MKVNTYITPSRCQKTPGTHWVTYNVHTHTHTHTHTQTWQSRKSYCDTEKVCEDARSKFSEAETRLKKKDVKFFESVSGLEKTHKKASDRLKSCQKRTTVARNDYILSLTTTNAHLSRHATKDLPQIMLVRGVWLIDDPVPVARVALFMCRPWMGKCTTSSETPTHSTLRLRSTVLTMSRPTLKISETKPVW